MKMHNIKSKSVLAAAIAALVGSGVGIANATEPCGDFGECKALTEINSSDGDIGFHFLMDGDSLIYGAVFNPHGRKIFAYYPKRELRRQTSTELFQESAEPPCSLEVAEEGDEVVTLADFTSRWKTGTYYFFGINADWEAHIGRTTFSFNLPAAPADVEWELEEEEPGEFEGEISWEAGDDLGECSEELDELIAAGVVADPADVDVAQWEVVLEIDVDVEEEEDEDLLAVAGVKHVVRIPGDAEYEVEVPDDFLEALPENTPAKVEVGAISADDNATFSETDEICLNDSDPMGTYDEEEDAVLNGCGFEVEEDDDD